MPSLPGRKAPCSIRHQLATLERYRRLGDRRGEEPRALIDRLDDDRHAAQQPLRV